MFVFISEITNPKAFFSAIDRCKGTLLLFMPENQMFTLTASSVMARNLLSTYLAMHDGAAGMTLFLSEPDDIRHIEPYIQIK